ncbi:MAG: hypothetical protein LC100_16910 [Chitinophagales bacterium]|nr:hypothetical protein [Chitinophagales bacterium]
MKKFDIEFTHIDLGNIANFKINYKGKTYGGCVMRHWIFEHLKNGDVVCVMRHWIFEHLKNGDVVEITGTKIGTEMMLAAHHALDDTQEYKDWIRKIEAE